MIRKLTDLEINSVSGGDDNGGYYIDPQLGGDGGGGYDFGQGAADFSVSQGEFADSYGYDYSVIGSDSDSFGAVNNGVNYDAGGDSFFVANGAGDAEDDGQQSGIPAGYHASDVDPEGKYYMVKDGDTSNKLVLTPEAAQKAQENYDKLQHSDAQVGLASVPIGLLPGGALFGAIVGGVAGLIAVIGPPPKSPAK